MHSWCSRASQSGPMPMPVSATRASVPRGRSTGHLRPTRQSRKAAVCDFPLVSHPGSLREAFLYKRGRRAALTAPLGRGTCAVSSLQPSGSRLKSAVSARRATTRSRVRPRGGKMSRYQEGGGLAKGTFWETSGRVSSSSPRVECTCIVKSKHLLTRTRQVERLYFAERNRIESGSPASLRYPLRS